jgi:hypothetical protein
LEWPELYQKKRGGYPALGGRTMTEQEEQSLKEAKRAEKRAAEEIEQSARDQARRKANLAREQAIEEDQEARKLKAKKQSRE